MTKVRSVLSLKAPWLKCKDGSLDSDYVNVIIPDIIYRNPGIPSLTFEGYYPAGYEHAEVRYLWEVPVHSWQGRLEQLSQFLGGDISTHVIGLASRTSLYADLHIPLLDFDAKSFPDKDGVSLAYDEACKAATILVDKYKQSRVWVVQSSPGGFHVVGSKPMPWSIFTGALSLASDHRYVTMSSLRHYGTVRITQNGIKTFTPRIVATVVGEPLA